MRTLLLTILLTCLLTGCGKSVLPGDAQPEQYLPLLRERKVAVYSNHTGVVDGKHLVDILLENGIHVSAIFSPEHGFRGKADAGAGVSDSVDPETGVPILSLYGPGGDVHPSAEAMSSFDVLVVDIQDVGLRFYTLYYENCLFVLRKVKSDGSVKDKVKYRNGSGLLYYSFDENILYWTDYTLKPEKRVLTFIKTASPDTDEAK